MVHVLVIDDNVVFGGHVISDVVVNDQSQQSENHNKLSVQNVQFKYKVCKLQFELTKNY